MEGPRPPWPPSSAPPVCNVVVVATLQVNFSKISNTYRIPTLRLWLYFAEQNMIQVF